VFIVVREVWNPLRVHSPLNYGPQQSRNTHICQ
jgi:hypothetical protein